MKINSLMKRFVILVALLATSSVIWAQEKGVIANFMIIDGDTIPVFNLPEVSIVEKVFNDPILQARYSRLKRNALIVYPYGKIAIQTIVEVEDSLQKIKNDKDRKKFLKSKDEAMKKLFEDRLKNLTKNQGYILIEMIERETNMSMHDIIKNYRGGFKAFYWNTFGKFYGYDLKNVYHPEQDPDLENILKTLDISYKNHKAVINKKK